MQTSPTNQQLTTIHIIYEWTPTLRQQACKKQYNIVTIEHLGMHLQPINTRQYSKLDRPSYNRTY
jgi:hypothetical protein